MKLLCIYRHYAPDTAPYGTILKIIAEDLAAIGHQVSVLTAQPSYAASPVAGLPWRESAGGVEIRRLRLLPERRHWKLVRVLNVALFQLQAMFYALVTRSTYDAVLVNSNPAIVSGLGARMVGFLTGKPFVYHCQDLHPEAMQLAGMVGDGWLFRFLRWVDAGTCKRAAAAVVISDDMRQVLLDRGVADTGIRVIHNFGLYRGGPDHMHDDARGKIETKDFTILFAGNLGNFQNLEIVCEAAMRLKEHRDIKWVFMGEGAAKERLMSQVAPLLGETVFFEPYKPVAEAFDAMRQASLGLVSLQKGIYRVAFPSKTSMYLEAGCPLLVVIEQESELARMVEEKEIGYSCAPESADVIARTVLEAYGERKIWDTERRDEVRRAGQGLFGREQILKQWNDELPALISNRTV